MLRITAPHTRSRSLTLLARFYGPTRFARQAKDKSWRRGNAVLPRRPRRQIRTACTSLPFELSEMDMSDRTNTLTVILERDMRTDDAAFLINAILAMRNVLTVRPTIIDGSEYAAKSQAKHEIKMLLYKTLDNYGE